MLYILLWKNHQLTLLLSCALLLSACGSEDDSSAGAGSSALNYSGLWTGITEENVTAITEIPTYLLFDAETLYLLREDEAQIGTYELDDNGLLSIDVDIYSYATPDTDNNFYIGVDSALNLTLSALIVTDEDMVINYNNATRAGRSTLTLDSGQTKSITQADVAGGWKTTDSTMQISSVGRFSGWNADTSCQWEGRLTPLSSTLLRLNIKRENCTEFNINGNQSAEGLAFIDGESILHFIALDGNDFLWMQFSEEGATAAVVATP